jgi:hypothetical protein
LDPIILSNKNIPTSIPSRLEARDIGLWIEKLPENQTAEFVRFISLPWRFVVLSDADNAFLLKLEESASADQVLLRRRGFVQIIDSDPSRIELPTRSLPIYLLNGRRGESSLSFESQLRKLTILEAVRRSEPRQILVVGTSTQIVPDELKQLWTTGFRSEITIGSTDTRAILDIEEWSHVVSGNLQANIIELTIDKIAIAILDLYDHIYPEDRTIIRVRDSFGGYAKYDITSIDDPERPILEFYQAIQERDLTPISPQELSHEEFTAFFRNPSESWRPYAAGLPWRRDSDMRDGVFQVLKKLDSTGAEENRIAYIAAEPGSGGTTMARLIAWECAQAGYPTLVAKQIPFAPDALRLINFMTAAHSLIEDRKEESGRQSRLYEAPWVIVFDVLHWQARESELDRFKAEIQKSGRPACILTVCSSSIPLAYHMGSSFRHVGSINHIIDQSEARKLGEHLNRFLKVYGRELSARRWDAFYSDHTVRLIEGAAAFWITLSFWIQGQYDLSRSIQDWLYQAFKGSDASKIVKRAIIDIAAFSTERLPIPESLLPRSNGKWPTSQLLSDVQTELASLGLVRISSDGIYYWGMVHDILGRFLLNALYFDFQAREEFGFATVNSPEELRFAVLKRISAEPCLGEFAFRSTGEDFATTIFKIDQDRTAFAHSWREVLKALNDMPMPLRDNSRIFRHHVAISRRRIAMLDSRIYEITNQDRLELIRAAVADISYALNEIPYTPGSESDLNLLNSLARAYQDLEQIEGTLGASKDRLRELRILANQATRRAYDESPANSFTIETYVKNLLVSAREEFTDAAKYCVEALGVLYSALSSNEIAYRATELQKLADQAVSILFGSTTDTKAVISPRTATDVLAQTWRVLASGHSSAEWSLNDASAEEKEQALRLLQNPIVAGNIQAIRLSYDLTGLLRPFAFKEQLHLAEQLQHSSYKAPPQLTLEYAILLYQAERAFEGDVVFKNLRNLWRESEHFVHVPDRLRWLRSPDGVSLKVVSAITASDYGNRTLARVEEFRQALVPFRPEEHSMSAVRPGSRFKCHVSFGHNGPFLRPVTAGPAPAGERHA